MTFDSRFDPTTDPSLLRELKSTSGDGWGRFDDRYRPLISWWCRKNCPPSIGQDDAVQTVMLHLFRKLREYEHDPERGRFRGWLRVVVSNAMTDLARKELRAPTVNASPSWWNDQGAEASVDDLECELEKRLRVDRALAQVRSQVSEASWEAFWRSFVESQTASEVAESLGISVGAVYQATYRCKSLFRKVYDAAPLDQQADERQ